MAESGLVRIENDVFASGRFRTPVCICIDVSASMREIVDGVVFDTGRIEMHDGEVWKVVEGGVSRMQKTVEFLKEFKRVLLDNGSEESVDLCIVTFSDDARVAMHFTPLGKAVIPDSFEASGGTNLGLALKIGLKAIDDRIDIYRSEGVEYFPPLMIVMSDGTMNGDYMMFDEMCGIIHRNESQRGRLRVIPVALDDKKGKRHMDAISIKGSVGLHDPEFLRSVFEWINWVADDGSYEDTPYERLLSSSSESETHLPKMPDPEFCSKWNDL